MKGWEGFLVSRKVNGMRFKNPILYLYLERKNGLRRVKNFKVRVEGWVRRVEINRRARRDLDRLDEGIWT